MGRKKLRRIEEAPLGSTWELSVNKTFMCLVVVIEERSLTTGNHSCVVLEVGSNWTSKVGTRINAAVTTANGWKRVT